MGSKQRTLTAQQIVLRALIPYSREGLLLAFKPSKFFYELEMAERRKRRTLNQAMYRAKRNGYVEPGLVPKLTQKGWSKIARLESAHKDTGYLLVVFDIPESASYARRAFRRLLRSLEFRLVQRSVWTSEYDHRSVLLQASKELKIDDCIRIYDALEIK